jgi:D-alanine-D-alanine ligase
MPGERHAFMRILIVHTDIPPDAPPDDKDTLLQAAAIEAALKRRGHEAVRGVFVPDESEMEALIARENPDVVFNLVETLWGRGLYAPLAPAFLTSLGVPYTGADSSSMAACTDKILTKRILDVAGLPTPSWSEAPHWRGIDQGRWIVKSVTEDASLGLDDAAVVTGKNAVVARAQECAARHGGRWFAERYVHGREFNVAVIEREGEPVVLPIGELVFRHWEAGKPRIVGYAAKWDEATAEYRDTTRSYGWDETQPGLKQSLEQLSRECWTLFGLTGYARVDFRVDAHSRPFILEVNPNPCLEPDAGIAASCRQVGYAYDDLIEDIVRAALKA